MPHLTLHLKKKQDFTHTILIEPGCFRSIPSELKRQLGRPGAPTKVCIVTDLNVKKLYGEKLRDNLNEIGVPTTLLSFQTGETHKNLTTVEKLSNQMVQLGHNRHSLLIALGGGVVGDVVGFLASIFMRGIPFIQIPTTLIAMADSSVGGKNGVDLNGGKNLIGTFHQPLKIYIDPDLLTTLSKKQRQNGLAEIAKHGFIADKKILKILTKFPDKAVEGHPTVLTHLLERSCNVKRKIVEKDERESHERMALNLGHTLGHAIEHASGYRLPHGQAVALGMVLEGHLAEKRGLLKLKHLKTMEAILNRIGLPTQLPPTIDRAPILKALAADKKQRGPLLTFALLKRPGKVKIVTDVTSEEVTAIL